MGFKEFDELKEMIDQMDPGEFVAVFLLWLENHDDENVESWSDVVTTLHEYCSDELSCAAQNSEPAE